MDSYLLSLFFFFKIWTAFWWKDIVADLILFKEVTLVIDLEKGLHIDIDIDIYPLVLNGKPLGDLGGPKITRNVKHILK